MNHTKGKKMPTGGSFKPGQSGNPSGRPKQDVGLIAYCRATSQEMANILCDIARDTNASPSARVSAATSIIERGWGKPTQPINPGKVNLDQMTDEELAVIAGLVDDEASALQCFTLN